jgi:hypothetical protein
MVRGAFAGLVLFAATLALGAGLNAFFERAAGQSLWHPPGGPYAFVFLVVWAWRARSRVKRGQTIAVAALHTIALPLVALGLAVSLTLWTNRTAGF